MSFGKLRDEKEDKGTASSFAVSGSGSEKVEAFLGKGSKIVGQLSFSGPVELDGHVEGEVVAQDRLIIGEAAVIQAKISGSDVVVKGTVNGDIVAKKLALKRPAKVVGNISTSSLSIEEGVIFEGKSSMAAGPSVKPQEVKPAPKPGNP